MRTGRRTNKTIGILFILLALGLSLLLPIRIVRASSSPDLTVTSVSYSPSSATVGQSISVIFTVKNQGTSASGSFSNRISLSPPQYQWGTAYPLGNFSMDSLAAGASRAVTVTTNPINASVPCPGSYYVTVFTDGFQQISESNEGNNIGSSTPSMISVSCIPPQQVQYFLIINTNGQGTTSPAWGTYYYDQGTQVTIMASPASGWNFSYWGGDASGTSTSTIITMNSNKNITAYFSQAAPTQYTLNVSINGQGATNPGLGSHNYDAGTQVTIIAVPSSGWNFSSWGGDASGTSTSATIIMNSNKSVTAYFQTGNQGPIIDKQISLGPYTAGNKYYLRIYNVDDVAKAIVNNTQVKTVNYYQDSGWFDITQYLKEGDNSIELTVENSSAGWTYGFDLRQNDSNIWQDSCGNIGVAGCKSNDQTRGLVYRCLITLTTSSTPPTTQYILTISTNGQGTTNPGTGTYTYSQGSQVTVTASAASGWKFDHWGGGASGTSTSVTTTMDSNKSVIAYFSQIIPTQYNLTINTSGQGTTIPASGTYNYSQGNQVTITASPASGWKFDYWGGDASGTSSSTTIIMDSNKSVTAYFTELSSTKPTVDNPKWTGNFYDDPVQMILARAIFGEARGESRDGKVAVGWVIRNRAENGRWWGTDYHGVILKPLQFSAFNQGDTNRIFVEDPLHRNSQQDREAWYECYGTAGQVLNSEIADTTKRADHFYSISIPKPSWADEAKFTIQIGNHRFYRLELSAPAITAPTSTPSPTPTPSPSPTPSPPPVTSCSVGQFRAEYYNGRSLEGIPASTGCESGFINYNWRLGGPTEKGVDVDNFSVRWESTFNFSSAGDYTFTARADDGIMVWVDDNKIIDDWTDHAVRPYTVNRYIPAGVHKVKVEYYENGGFAEVQVNWQPSGLKPLLLEVPFFSQKNSQWGEERLGNNGPYVKDAGCALTSVAMVFRFYGVDLDPYQLNKWLSQNAGYDGEGNILWEKAKSYPGAKDKVSTYNKTLDIGHGKSPERVLAEDVYPKLKDGIPVIASVPSSRGIHFIVFIGRNDKAEYIFYDPSDNTEIKRVWPTGVEIYKELRTLRIYAR